MPVIPLRYLLLVISHSHPSDICKEIRHSCSCSYSWKQKSCCSLNHFNFVKVLNSVRSPSQWKHTQQCVKQMFNNILPLMWAEQSFSFWQKNSVAVYLLCMCIVNLMCSCQQSINTSKYLAQCTAFIGIWYTCVVYEIKCQIFARNLHFECPFL